MSKKASDIDYHSLQRELEVILDDLQRDDTDVDTAMQKYERGLAIVQQLDAYLKHAENTVQELQAKFSHDG